MGNCVAPHIVGDVQVQYVEWHDYLTESNMICWRSSVNMIYTHVYMCVFVLGNIYVLTLIMYRIELWE